MLIASSPSKKLNPSYILAKTTLCIVFDKYLVMCVLSVCYLTELTRKMMCVDCSYKFKNKK